MSEQTIFDALTENGCSVTGALSLMGNWQEESGNEPCRLQGDFQADRFQSKEYARKVDNGLMSDEEFIFDGKGWGIPQFTFWTRKRGFLRYCRNHSLSIGSEEGNIGYVLEELRTEYKDLWTFLQSCEDEQLYEAVERVCREYEKPAYNNIQARANAAVEIRNRLKIGKKEEKEQETMKFWPPRGARGGRTDPGLCNGMNGPDVEAAQGLLYARGYTYGSTKGVFGDSMEKAVRKFQMENVDINGNPLQVDGVIGPKSWGALCKF